MKKNNEGNLTNQKVTLEDALHKMSNALESALLWDVIWGTIVSIPLAGFIIIDRNPVYLFYAAILAIAAAAGHMLFYLFFKMHPYTRKMLVNTAKYLPIGDSLDYEMAVKESLNGYIYIYEDVLLVTEEYIIGNAEPNFRYIPVAVPREKITELIFSRQSIPCGRYSVYAGILSCRTNNNKKVDLVIGKASKAEEILRMLNLYNIEWKMEITKLKN